MTQTTYSCQPMGSPGFPAGIQKTPGLRRSPEASEARDPGRWCEGGVRRHGVTCRWHPHKGLSRSKCLRNLMVGPLSQSMNLFETPHFSCSIHGVFLCTGTSPFQARSKKKCRNSTEVGLVQLVLFPLTPSKNAHLATNRFRLSGKV